MDSEENDQPEMPKPHSTENDSPDDSASPNVPQLINLNQHKAGLDHLDKDKINKIIQEASKGSNYYIHQQTRQKRIDQQIEEHQRALHCVTDTERNLAIGKANRVKEDLERKRILNRIVVHFDMDMFFAAVEIKKNPKLIDKPVAVGSMAMISTSNYVARKFGVRSAMAGFIGKKLCPQLILINHSFADYSKESKFIMNIISEYDPNMSSFSLDEVYIDLTDYVLNKYSNDNLSDISELRKLDKFPDELWNFAYDTVNQIRARVLKESKLSISAGIACNTLLAKVCTDINKPNGQFMVKGDREEILQFVSNLEVRKFPGIGPVSGTILTSAFGIRTAHDISTQLGNIFSVFSERSAIYYTRLSLGIGSSFISNDDTPQKSYSRERTVGELSKLEDMYLLLVKISRKLSNDLKFHGQQCRTITLKMKKTTFEVFIKTKSISNYTDDEQIIVKVAKDLLSQEVARSPATSYRLIGVKASNLRDKEAAASSSSRQLTLSQLLPNCATRSVENADHLTEQKEDSTITTVTTSAKMDCHYQCTLCEKTFDLACEFDLHRLQCEGDLDGFWLENDNFGDDGLEMSNEVQLMESEEDASVSRNELHSKELNGTEADQSKPNSVFSAPLSSSNVDRVTCPVCRMTSFFDNHQFNCHLDKCLNKNMVIKLTKVPVPSTSTTPSAQSHSSPFAKKAPKSKRTVASEKKANKRQKSTSNSTPLNSQLSITNFFNNG